jgi:aminobenzoyl-glutamate utilization protein B
VTGGTGEVKELSDRWVEGHRQVLSDWHRVIWHLAEPAWREYESAAWYVERLRAEGFDVEEGSAGMPTAFCARWSNGRGPTVLTYAEYDAVPGNCQAATTRPEPREGLSRFAPGHTDPHSALGISALAGALATKQAMEETGLSGTLVVTGEPAEKVQGSKVVHGLRGYYDGVDAIVSFHPFYMLPLCNTVVWDTHCAAYFSRIYTFVCDHPETWGSAEASPIAASHSAARAPGANAALWLMWSTTSATRDAMLPAVGGWSLSDAILTAGQATADNLPASLAQIQYSWRTPDVSMADRVLAVLDENADAAARATHCTVETRWVARNRPGLANHALAKAAWQNLSRVGPPRWGPDAAAVANELRAALGAGPLERPWLAETEVLVEPEEAERRLRAAMPGWQTHWTSDDYTEMTWYAPTVRLYVARPTLSTVGLPGRVPNWVMNALGGIPATIDPMILCAAKVIAGTLLDLLASPELLSEARSEWEERRARTPVPPLLPADFQAPVDYRWPEYVTTPRGRDWWIPASAEY